MCAMFRETHRGWRSRPYIVRGVAGAIVTLASQAVDVGPETFEVDGGFGAFAPRLFLGAVTLVAALYTLVNLCAKADVRIADGMLTVVTTWRTHDLRLMDPQVVAVRHGTTPHLLSVFVTRRRTGMTVRAGRSTVYVTDGTRDYELGTDSSEAMVAALKGHAPR